MYEKFTAYEIQGPRPLDLTRSLRSSSLSEVWRKPLSVYIVLMPLLSIPFLVPAPIHWHYKKYPL